MRLDFEKTAKEVYRVVLKDVSAYGGFPFYFTIVLAALLLESYQAATTLFISLVAVTLVVALVRLAYYKPRPGQPRKKFSTYYERIDGSSFPSIHVARAVMISLAFYQIASALMPLYFLLTLLVCLSRIEFKRHDLTDMLAGGIIGIALGYIFFFA